MSRQLHLNLFIYPDGHHEAAWRHPDSQTDRILDISYYQELAQRAEAATFDAVFFADGPSLAENIQYAARFRLEPITVMTAIVAATERIGVIGTASTTYTEPYNLARQLAALDHLSKGRAGWNIVTTGAADAALNFGLDAHPTIAGGRVPLILHLLSPAQRPIQITRDLPGFWRGSWAAVKADMRGQYPKHPWPDDPISALPTRRANRR